MYGWLIKSTTYFWFLLELHTDLNLSSVTGHQNMMSGLYYVLCACHTGACRPTLCKLQVPRFSYNWWRFQAWDTVKDSTDNSGIDKAETSLEWQEYFSQLQDTTDALPCHINLPTLTAELQRRIQAMEVKCYCKIFHTKAMLPMRKSVPRSSRQLDHMKTS